MKEYACCPKFERGDNSTYTKNKSICPYPQKKQKNNSYILKMQRKENQKKLELFGVL
jgi:hypothetical protein